MFEFQHSPGLSILTYVNTYHSFILYANSYSWLPPLPMLYQIISMYKGIGEPKISHHKCNVPKNHTQQRRRGEREMKSTDDIQKGKIRGNQWTSFDSVTSST